MLPFLCRLGYCVPEIFQEKKTESARVKEAFFVEEITVGVYSRLGKDNTNIG